MEVMVRKYQQRFRKVKDEMNRWEYLQLRLISHFKNASFIIERLQVIRDPKNYGSLSRVDGFVDALIAKQLDSLQLCFSSIRKALEDLWDVVRSMEKIYRDGKQMIKGGSNQPSVKQLRQRIGVKPSLEDCLNGLLLLCNMHRSEYLLKESLFTALSGLVLKPSAQELSSLQQLLVDQPNIQKEEVEFLSDIILVAEA